MTLFHENSSLGLVYLSVNVEMNLKASVQHRVTVLVIIVKLSSQNPLSTLNSIVMLLTDQDLATSTAVTNAMGWVAVPLSRK